MKLQTVSFFRKLHREESGQTLAIVILGMMAFIGLGGLTIDMGRYYTANQMLQSSTNAAALAGASALPNTADAITAATTYSSASGGKNADKSFLTNVSLSSTTFKCLTTLATAPLPYPCVYETGSTTTKVNAMIVTQTATVPLLFGTMFGVPTFQAAATATATIRGGNAPYNVAIILDATLSQNSTDDNCLVNGVSVSEMQCELNGVQIFLAQLLPCQPKYTTCTVSNGVSTGSIDRVAIFTFPAVTLGSSTVESTCTSQPTATWVNSMAGGSGNVGSSGSGGWNYSATYGGYFDMPSSSNVHGYSYQGAGGNNTGAWPSWPIGVVYPTQPAAGASSYQPTGSNTATYEVTSAAGGDTNGFFSDYKNSYGASSLNTNSLVVKIAGGGTSCGGLSTVNYDGAAGTFYAGAIYAAQAALAAEQLANPGSDNKIIILSDGDANASQSNMASGANGTGTYPSYKNDCAQAVTAAKYATSQGTEVISIAYGSELTGCKNDNPAMTPCQTMTQMASTPQDFYSDYYQNVNGGAGVNTNCVSAANPDITSLSDIFFNTYYTGFGRSRLVPNGIT